MRISVDVGFGYVKAVNEHKKTIDFPSVVDPKIESALGGFGAEEDYSISIKGEKDALRTYLVGDAAMSMGGSRAFDDQVVNNKNLDVLISTAIALLLDGSDEPVDLAVGLPMDYYGPQKDDLQKRFENYTQNIVLEGKEIKIHVQSVFVFPQGAGAYYASVFDINGEVKNQDLFNKAVGVIDIGHRTTDFIYMTRTKKGLAPVPGLTGSLDLGMKNVFKNVTENLYTEVQRKAKSAGKTPKKPSQDEVEKAVLWFNGELNHQSEHYKLDKHLTDASKIVASNIADQIKAVWSDKEDNLAAIMIGGGGGDTLYRHFEDAFNGVRKVDNPRFANAEGYLAAQAQMLNNRKS
jgi:plasmid segregation protein ParM